MFLQLIQTAVSREANIPDFEAFSKEKEKHKKKMSASFVLIFSLAYP